MTRKKKIYDEENDKKVFPDRNEEDEIVEEEIEKEDNDSKLLDEVLGAGDEKPDFELEPEENPHIDDFTAPNNNGIPPVTSIKISEEDRLRVIVAQLQMQNLELESKIIEQKHARKVDELNKLIADYKDKYTVPDEWKLHAPSGTFNKG